MIRSLWRQGKAVGDDITNDVFLSLDGKPAAKSLLFGDISQFGTDAVDIRADRTAHHVIAATDKTDNAAANAPNVASSKSAVAHDTVASPSIGSFSSDSGTVGDGITNVSALTLNGTAEANSTVKVYDGATLLGSVVASGSGAWTYTTVALANGGHSLTATATDAAGNTSPSSTALTVTVDTPASMTIGSAPALTVADGATVEIDGASAQSVTFTGTTGTLKLDNSLAFTGQVSGLAGTDALDLADVSYGANTQATFLGNTNGGTLTVTDGTHTANIALVGNYLSSTWDLSSDGNGGTVVVDPVASNNWQTLKVGAGGWLTGMDIAPDGTMVVRADTYGAYIWNGTQWQQLVTSTSMPAAFTTQDVSLSLSGQQASTKSRSRRAIQTSCT